MKIEVYTKDFGKDVAALGPKSFSAPSLPCSAAVDISGNIDAADYNILRDRLLQSLRDSKLAEKLIAELAKLTKEADDDVALEALKGKDKAEARLKQYRKDMQAEVDAFAKQVSETFTKSWTTFVADHDKYRTYKIKAALDVTVSAISLAASIAGLATSATPAAPATLPLAIYGIGKNLTKLVIQCRNLYIEAETVGKEVETEIGKVRKKLDDLEKLEEKAATDGAKGKKAASDEVAALEKDASGTDAKKAAEAKKKLIKAKEKLKELTVSFGNKLTGDAVGLKIVSIEGLASRNSLYGNKIRGIQEGTRGMARDCIDMTDKMTQLHDYVRALDDDYKKTVAIVGWSAPARSALAEPQKKVAVAFKAWSETVKAVKSIQADVEASEKRCLDNLAKQKKFGETVTKAQEAFKTKNWAEAGRWLGVAADVGLSVTGGASAFANTDKIVGTSMKLVLIAEKEVITELKNRVMV